MDERYRTALSGLSPASTIGARHDAGNGIYDAAHVARPIRGCSAGRERARIGRDVGAILDSVGPDGFANRQRQLADL
jgi:hypothetical protein